MTRDEVAEIFAAKLPIGDSELGVELVLAGDPSITEEAGEYRTTLQMIVYRVADDGSRAINDIKEQEVYAGRLGEQTPERLAAFLDGWDAAFRAVVRAGAEMDTFMPHDLSPYGVLALKTVHLAEEFEQALLARKRLGRCLPRGVDPSVPATSIAPPHDDDAL